MDRIHFTPRGSARVADIVLDSIPPFAYTTQPLRDALAARGETPDPGLAPLDALAALASHASPAVRRQAVWAMGRRGPASDRTGSSLDRALGDSDPSVRAESARALDRVMAAGGQAGGPRTVAHLAALLDDPRQEVRWAAADALGARAVDPRSDLDWLLHALGSPDAYIRGFAAWTLGRAGPAAGAAAPALEKALRDPEPGLRALAVRALGNIGRSDAAVVASLADVVAHGVGEGRWRALRALAKLGPSAAPAVGVMAAALADPDEKVRREAALALDRVGPPASAAVPALVAAERDAVPEVRDAAAQALRTITASH
jgi:HEAT repeat protein